MSPVLPSSVSVTALTDTPVDPDKGKEKTKTCEKLHAVNSQGVYDGNMIYNKTAICAKIEEPTF